MATKAEQIYDRVNQMVAEGTEKADSFRQIADETKRPFDSVRGSYYSHKKKIEGGETRPRTRRRETTPETALEDARAALERAVEQIDKEVETAKSRAQEAAGEYEEIRGSAEERKAEITKRLEATQAGLDNRLDRPAPTKSDRKTTACLTRHLTRKWLSQINRERRK
jgi:hypothetical protein